ncbi:hypothetical protein LVO85_16555, partial [Ornithinimicrobium sp. EGI L100131]|nr:hypothetical protein [Ornithinimicrobium sediminis]
CDASSRTPNAISHREHDPLTHDAPTPRPAHEVRQMSVVRRLGITRDGKGGSVVGIATTDPGPTTIRPLSEESWGLLAALVERHNGIFGGCWCIWFHPDSEERCSSYAGNRALKERLVEHGAAHAALVVRDGDERARRPGRGRG